MKILSVIAQKPNSTGSGVYLAELVKAFDSLGHEETVIAGIYEGDQVILPCGVSFYPMYYKTKELPFAIPGMSDEMPYESTIYSQMSDQMIEKFKNAFYDRLSYVIHEFEPDIIICHHLYLLTALVRDRFPEQRVVAICHGTDLRQIKKNSLQKQYIIDNIKKIDMICALHSEQMYDIEETYGVNAEKIKVVGSGYNKNIFYNMELPKEKNHINVIYAGKLNEKKGVIELVKALDYLTYDKTKFTLRLAGGNGNAEEFKILSELIKNCRYDVKLLGKLSQNELAREFNSSDIFILPSFYEGLPLVLIEALACGLKVIATDLPGIRQWMNQNIPNNDIIYIKPPTLINTDEPKVDELPQFRQDIADAIKKAVDRVTDNSPDLGTVSWEGIAQKII